MSLEISYLIASVWLYGFMIAVQAVITDKEHGLKSSAGARDGVVDKNVSTQRAKRANANMVEAMVLFVPLILAK